METITEKLKKSGLLQAVWGVAVLVALGMAIGSEPHTKKHTAQHHAVVPKAIVTVQ